MPFIDESTNSFSIERKPVNVFVAPVGALTKMLFLEWISITPYN